MSYSLIESVQKKINKMPRIANTAVAIKLFGKPEAAPARPVNVSLKVKPILAKASVAVPAAREALQPDITKVLKRPRTNRWIPSNWISTDNGASYHAPAG
jgi:hypothetical protein